MNEINKKLKLNDDLSIEKNRNLIFVYCSPKVGSTSLVSSVRLFASNTFSVLHLHNEAMLEILYGIKNVTINDIIKYNKSLGKNVYVIDIFRSPIEQKMSHFFEEIGIFHFNNTEEQINKMPTEQLIHRFNNIFQHTGAKDYFKMVYNIGFDYDLSSTNKFNKYILKEVDGIKYIKLRLKDSLESWSESFKQIMNIDIKIVKDYETESKTIKDTYIRFKQNYRIPGNLMELIKSDKSLQFYYSEHERNEYINSWTSKQCGNITTYTEQEYALYKLISRENIGHKVTHRNHYMDTGCTCRGCAYKRTELIKKIQSGEQTSGQIIHSNVVKIRIPIRQKQRQQPQLKNKFTLQSFIKKLK